MAVQVIQPAGASQESKWVLLLCCLIVLAAAITVSLHHESHDEVPLADNLMDVRRDLNAAEQGIHADLTAANDEILQLQDDAGQAPEPPLLAAEQIAPFVIDSSAAKRGDHSWQLLRSAGQSAYFGNSTDSHIAGSFLLLPLEDTPAIWINRGPHIAAPAALDSASLQAAGWQQVISQFDAGVTRQHRH